MKITRLSRALALILLGLAVNANSQSFLTNGLVAYYPFNGSANDTVGTNNGTVYGAILAPDRFGSLDQSFSFNGTNSYIAFPRSTGSIPGATQLTISAWVQFSGGAAGYQAFFGHWIDHSTYQGQSVGIILFRSAANSIIISMTAGTGCLGTAKLGTGYWHNIVVTFKGAESLSANRIRLFIDGQADTLDTTQPSSVPAVIGSLAVSTLLGTRQSGLGNIELFSGGIDDVRIYNRALSPSEVQQLYAYESSPTPLPPTPPSITFQPQSVTVNAHDNVSFNVAALGDMPLNYQWSFNGTNISGATSSSITISNVTQDALGAYAVIVGNISGSTTSSNALLSMRPYIHKPFVGAITYWGKEGSFSVEAWGTGPLGYQWYRNGAAVQNATNQTFTLPSMQFTNGGLYSVVVSSTLGSVTNGPAEVVVNPAGVSLGMFPGVVVSGVVGYTYNIQATSDLTNPNSWTTVATLTLMQPVQLWVDTRVDALSPTNPHKYYKVVAGY